MASERPLLRDAFAALAEHDDRFCLIKPSVLAPPEPSRDGSHQPLVVLLDGEGSEQRGLALLTRWRPVGGVLLITEDQRGTPSTLPEGPVRIGGVEMAVCGYDASWATVSKALVLASKRYFPPRTSDDESVEPQDRGKRLADDLELYRSLSPREKQVLAEIGFGRTPQQFAKQLGVAVSTAENHKSRLMKKTNFHKSVELVRFAIRVGAAPV